ncbi:MAG: imidazole glycerol phosphate synthase subunit HisH, partial [Clostridia bacterium]|nr:imidazole glycerol phosphate synthase subunit HisH [Clostridia bacterium]
LQSSFAAIGKQVVVSGDPEIIAKATKVILPGVGAFADASQKLKESGLANLLCQMAKKGTPIMGICLGMQLLLEKSYEYGEYEGLGLIPGSVRPIAEKIEKGLKIPHIGWNALDFTRKDSRLLRYVREGEFVYFVHSYYGADCHADTVATAEYGAPLTAVVERGNVCGCQFHPEKSGDVGLRILRAFCED